MNTYDLGPGKRVVGYCRFSSNNQREESIEAQERAIKGHCERKGWVIVGWYEDRALSGTSDDRPEFLRMVDDSAEGLFDIVLVHKLDRFSRDIYDKELYKRKLEENGVILQSVLEELTDTPESLLMEGVISAMNAFYSKNLAREVKKGLQENALKGMFTGGVSPFGYSIDPSTKKYVVNEDEASGVRLIYQMTLEGHSYDEIQQELNQRGYRTRRGAAFGINSLHDILCNEKYTGLLIYNKHSVSTTPHNGKKSRRPHKPNDLSQCIVVEDALPAIISKELFQQVQELIQGRKNKSGAGKAKQVYLLSGKIVCGECGSAYAGNRRTPCKGSDKVYISYRCNRFNKKVECHNVEVNRELIEGEILKVLSGIIYDERKIPAILNAYQEFQQELGNGAVNAVNRLQAELCAIDKKLGNMAEAIACSGSSPTLISALSRLEEEKVRLTADFERAKANAAFDTIDEAALRNAFQEAKRTFEHGELPEIKYIVQRFVDKVVVYPDGIQVSLNLGNGRLHDVLEEREKQGAVANSVCNGTSPHYEGIMVRPKGLEPPAFRTGI